ncbi:hypothetical protein ACQEVF_44005 [Nonomuraea polychroma]|uniref:hypothetical protein n=1 Tax=Nonomuraea polychroma TaxID=46176 RepID=UPI003D9356F2
MPAPRSSRSTWWPNPVGSGWLIEADDHAVLSPGPARSRRPLARLRAAPSQIAVIRADDGTVAGIVSLDDLLTTLLVPA